MDSIWSIGEKYNKKISSDYLVMLKERIEKSEKSEKVI